MQYVTRRGVLAATAGGIAWLAGCSGEEAQLTDSPESTQETIEHDALKAGTVADEPTVSSLTASANNAIEALHSQEKATFPVLHGNINSIVRQAYTVGKSYRSADRFDPDFAEAQFRFSSRYASAVPDAVSFLTNWIEP